MFCLEWNMPANLTPQYMEAEEKYKKARDPEEKLLALQEMLRKLPKHKGTEKIQADIKRKISEQKKSLAAAKGKKKKPSYYVDSHGYPQVVVIGAPNSGRSRLISQLTGADLKVADYPYTTTAPQPAMMVYDNVHIQLVDTPPIAPGHMDFWMPNVVRGGDAVLLVADLVSDSILEDVEAVIAGLEKHRIYLNDPPAEDRDGDIVQKALLVANKCDSANAPMIYELLAEAQGRTFEIHSVSAATGEGLETLKKKSFLLLDLVRVYPKPPGKPVDRAAPILLDLGSTVVDLADKIHHEMAQKLKGARLWGNKDFPEQVPRDYQLQDEDTIELLLSTTPD